MRAFTISRFIRYPARIPATQRPTKVTPTRMPSLGAIFRLLNFTMGSSGGADLSAGLLHLNQLLVCHPLASYLRASVEALTMPAKPQIIAAPATGDCTRAPRFRVKDAKARHRRGSQQEPTNQIGSRTCRNTGW